MYVFDDVNIVGCFAAENENPDDKIFQTVDKWAAVYA